MSSNNTYWKGVEELNQTPDFVENRDREFPEEIPVEEFLSDSKLSDSSHSRRDFLKFLGFSVAAATLAACEAPVIKSVPYVNKPSDVTPGVANWYASAYYDGSSFANILVKTREGRPIFIKGNKDHGITNGATNPRVIASVLSLYDGARLRGPHKNGGETTWATVDSEIKEKLETAAKKGGKIRILSNTVISPTGAGIIEAFKARFGGVSAAPAPAVEEGEEPVVESVVEENDSTATTAVGEPMITPVGSADIEHVQYDAVSYKGIKKANEKSFGKAVIPDYDFSKAETIVGIGADFLATWLNATEYAPQYGLNRDPEKVKAGEGFMSKHYQFESTLSITGSNADKRMAVKPSEFGAVAAAIYEALGGGSLGVSYSEEIKVSATAAAESLKKSGKNSLVVCGSNNPNVQTIVNAINEKLGAYTTTINLSNPVLSFNGNAERVNKLVEDVKAGSVDVLLVVGVNPVYSLPNGAELAEALETQKDNMCTVSFSGYADETASRATYITPDHHYLEGWNDYNPKENYYALAQPVIRPLFETQSWMESLAVWAGLTERVGKDSTYVHDEIKSNWMKYGYEMAKDAFDSGLDYWNWMVHNGGGGIPAKPAAAPSMNGSALSAAAKAVGAESAEGFEVVLYQKNAIGDGQLANNPWLQEMPDPITTVTWDNYITMAPSDVKKAGYNDYYGQESPASVAEVTLGDVKLSLPVIAQPGQAVGTIGIALGYGRGELMNPADRTKIGKGAYQTGEFGDYETDEKGNIRPIGANGYKLVQNIDGVMVYEAAGVTVKGTGETYPIAATQGHHTVMGRHSIIKETSLDFYTKGWKETDYASPKNREGFNPQHTLAIHEDVGGKRDENGRLEFIDGQPQPDGVIDANDRKHVSAFDLWGEHPVEKVGHRWGMTIDLNSCIGCGNCIIACQAENNVPVVGKDEVRRVRIMHWMRIDRYYKSEQEEFIGTRKEEWSYGEMEKPEDQPTVVFQPLMCQHCNHAPCETVCPVVATTHSNEGLNQMTYNRCIGTRYCANNCPYKVRRFNWFNYPSYKKFTAINPAQDDLGRMVLNPDVVVRTRGVMEKCSMCVQRIQDGKLTAKKEERLVKDGDIETACQGSCPTNAIIFGDLNDMKENVGEEEREGSAVYNSAKSDRSYHVLEEVGTKPNIFYKVKVRNIEDPFGEESMEYIVPKGGHGDEHAH